MKCDESSNKRFQQEGEKEGENEAEVRKVEILACEAVDSSFMNKSRDKFFSSSFELAVCSKNLPDSAVARIIHQLNASCDVRSRMHREICPENGDEKTGEQLSLHSRVGTGGRDSLGAGNNFG